MSAKIIFLEFFSLFFFYTIVFTPYCVLRISSLNSSVVFNFFLFSSIRTSSPPPPPLLRMLTTSGA